MEYLEGLFGAVYIGWRSNGDLTVGWDIAMVGVNDFGYTVGNNLCGYGIAGIFI